MGYPESELEREPIRKAIMEAKTSDEFFDKHFSTFRNSWMVKSFWTIKKHPEFSWGNNSKCYVQLPHHTTLRSVIRQMTWHRGPWHKSTQPNYEHHWFFWSGQKDLFPQPVEDTNYWALYAEPESVVTDMWRENYASVYADSFGLSSFELIPWSREGHPQKYLLIGNMTHHIGSSYIALVDDITGVPITNPYEENMPTKQE